MVVAVDGARVVTANQNMIFCIFYFLLDKKRFMSSWRDYARMNQNGCFKEDRNDPLIVCLDGDTSCAYADTSNHAEPSVVPIATIDPSHTKCMTRPLRQGHVTFYTPRDSKCDEMLEGARRICEDSRARDCDAVIVDHR